jgi:hypothetical protein
MQIISLLARLIYEMIVMKQLQHTFQQMLAMLIKRIMQCSNLETGHTVYTDGSNC